MRGCGCEPLEFDTLPPSPTKMTHFQSPLWQLCSLFLAAGKESLSLPRDRPQRECLLSVCNNMGYFPSLLPDASKKRPLFSDGNITTCLFLLSSPQRNRRCGQCRLGNDPLPPPPPSSSVRRFTPAKYRKPILRHHDRRGRSHRGGMGYPRRRCRKNRRGSACIRLRPSPPL